MQANNVVWGTDFQARRNRERALWPNPLDLMAMSIATTALMGDMWLQTFVESAPDER